ncbi:venom peptide HsVx1-like isoform X1 [Macrosteles quadrilineatus]|uniref:venom peptide HsVx1-like isoform X1 n=1 Tax=Macrosteles quadrilineatus TaxID=74068 RepID=UPI0023E28205|nr:venom peptide HsVx1-like isoform X1 [Macrosteles quadrilineatus]
MNIVNGIWDRWKSFSTEFEQNMNSFLIDFERFFEGTHETAREDSITKGEDEECEDGGKTYKVGESWTNEGECNLKVCHPRKVISVRKCPEWVAPKQCRTQNLFKLKNFPDCCPSVICPISTNVIPPKVL